MPASSPPLLTFRRVETGRSPRKVNPLATPAPRRIPPQAERKTTPGDFQMPRSIVENLGLMTHAELMLVTITLRRSQQALPPTLPDELWEKWTGKEARQKRRAIEGLRDKGLEVRGFGDKARYYFDPEKWENYIRLRDPEETANTAGYVHKPRPMHPDCAARGCQKACETTQCSDTIPPDAKVVSIESGPNEANKSGTLWSNLSNSDAKPQNLKNRGFRFPLALEAIRQFFPWVEKDFLGQLVSAVYRKCKYFTDEQLTQAIRGAKKRYQTSEALFLQTVPGRVRAITEGRIPPPEPPQQQNLTPETLRAHFDGRAQELDKQAMADIAQRVRLLDVEADVVELDSKIESIERDILTRLRQRVPVSVFKGALDKELKSYEGKMTLEQINRLREQATDRMLLEQAGIGRLSVYYA